MKKLFVAGVAVFIMAIGFLAMAAAAEEFTIIGYGPLQFAVVGEIERQANEMIESWGTKKPANIIVQGFADKTGKMAENEMIARDRAREMKAFLETKMDAKITALSKGDAQDARKVVVTVKFTVALPSASLPTAQPQASIFRVARILIGTALVVLLLNSLIGRWSRRGKAEKTKAQEIEAKKLDKKLEIIEASVDSDEEEVVEIIAVAGWKIKTAIKNGRYYAPFRHKKGEGNKIYAESRDDYDVLVTRLFKNPNFADQISKLLADGDLKKIHIKGGEKS